MIRKLPKALLTILLWMGLFNSPINAKEVIDYPIDSLKLKIYGRRKDFICRC